jgi:glycosyltransferase involved in cell wall biosynthesis
VNVVHVFPYSASVSGGHSNAIRAFIGSQRQAGINAVAISPKPDDPAAATVFDFPLVEVDSLWGLRWETIATRFGIAAGQSLLNFHSVNRRFNPLFRDLRQAGVPYVLTSHGQLGIQNASRWLQKFVYLNLVNRGLRHADGLHFLTTHAASQLKFVMPGYQGVSFVQGNLVSAPTPAKLPQATRSDYGIPNEAFALLFLGRLDVEIKGLDILIEAFSCLPPGQFWLILAGPDWKNGKAKLEKLAEQSGCRNRITFTGPIYGEKKWGLLRLANVFVSPSRREAFSIALVEAMVCGLPVVTSAKVHLATDLIGDGTALVCPVDAEALACAILTLAADREGQLTLGSNGRAWVEAHCSPDHAGVRFREFYESILARQQRGASA